MDTKIPNLRKLVAEKAPSCPLDGLNDEMVLAMAKGLKIKPQYEARPGKNNKRPRPGALYFAGPALKGSDGEDVKGAYIEAGALRPMINQLLAIEEQVRNGEIDIPEGYSLEFNESGELLRAKQD